jgi:hypothetical protein
MDSNSQHHAGLKDISKMIPHGLTEWSSLGWKIFGISGICLAFLSLFIKIK